MTKSLATVVGYDAPKFIAFLVEHLAEVAEIKFFLPPNSTPIQQDSALTEIEQQVVMEGLAIRDKLQLPFWDSILSYMATHGSVGKNILHRATRHNSQDVDVIRVTRGYCTEARLRGLIDDLPAGKVLALSSQVLLGNGTFVHLPMLDFHCHESSENDILVRSVLNELGLKGYVAKSGKSYHFYANSLVDEAALLNVLGYSLLFSPIVDRAWIAHQILERACGLRISPGKDYRQCPEISFEV